MMEDDTQLKDEHEVPPTLARSDRPLSDSAKAVIVMDVDPETAVPKDVSATVCGDVYD